MEADKVSFLSLFPHLLWGEYDDVIRMRWFQKYAWTSIVLCVLYVLLVFSGQRWMHNRPKMSLRTPLTLWSLALSIFSARGSYVMASHILPKLYTDSLQMTICGDAFYDGIAGYWLCLFALSKALELLDTAFLVLKKRKVIFLHWYHHAFTVFYCAYCYQYRNNAPCQVNAMINYTVHAVMYMYYALRASGYARIPKVVNICITTFQIVQMLIGAYLFLLAYQLKSKGVPCLIDDYVLFLTMTMYVTYLALFIRFFVATYFPAKKDSNKNE